MNDQGLLRNLEFEYYSILAANPQWETSLRDFLVSRGFSEREALEAVESRGFCDEETEQ